jgi:hypothetical protein
MQLTSLVEVDLRTLERLDECDVDLGAALDAVAACEDPAEFVRHRGEVPDRDE